MFDRESTDILLRNIEHRSKNAVLKFGLKFAQFDKRIPKITDFLWRDAFLNKQCFFPVTYNSARDIRILRFATGNFFMSQAIF